MPLTSRCSHDEREGFRKISIKSSSPIIPLARSRISFVGLTKALIVIMPAERKSFEISAMRRMFSNLSALLKPRLLLIPHRTLSPSSTWQNIPFENKCFSNANARVVLPEHGSPVNHITFACCPSFCSLDSRLTNFSKRGYTLPCSTSVLLLELAAKVLFILLFSSKMYFGSTLSYQKRW